jgi:hypothetical protein
MNNKNISVKGNKLVDYYNLRVYSKVVPKTEIQKRGDINMATMIQNLNRRRHPYSKLKGFFVEKGVSQKEVAVYLSKSQSALNQNLNGTGGDFSLSEARSLINKYNIPPHYFFEIQVPNTELKEAR